VAATFRRGTTPVPADFPPVASARRERNAAVPQRRRHSQPSHICRGGGIKHVPVGKNSKLEMWADVRCDGRPAEYRWRPLFNAAKFG